MFRRCVNRLGFVLGIVALPVIFAIIFPTNLSAQGQLYCAPFGMVTCQKDGQVIPNPDCADGFVIKPPTNPDYEDRCKAQMAEGTDCNNVPCTKDPSGPDFCGPDQICTGLDVGQCKGPGDSFRSCTVKSGGIGSCCQSGAPPTPPPDNGCPPNEYCWNWGGAACRADGGSYDASRPCTSLKDGQTAYCCIPGNPTKCDSGDVCDRAGGGNAKNTCENNQGTYGACLRFDGKETGNCCLPGSDVYICELSGSLCVPNLSSVGSRCGANFGHCPAGDDRCLSCDEISESACMGTNLRCVEQNETTGYYCQSSVVGCYPCFDYNADPDSPYYIPACDPPSYKSSTPDGNFGNCKKACSGQVPVTYRCQDKYGCIQDDSGEFKGMQQCGIECGGNELFCDLDGKPVVMPVLEWVRFNTSVGCIPFTVKGSEEVGINYVLKFFLSLGTGLAGGFALFIIIIGSVQIMTSAGDPQKVQAGRELITAAISGLLLLIFGVFMLRVIGINVLGIPGL